MLSCDVVTQVEATLQSASPLAIAPAPSSCRVRVRSCGVREEALEAWIPALALSFARSVTLGKSPVCASISHLETREC